MCSNYLMFYTTAGVLHTTILFIIFIILCTYHLAFIHAAVPFPDKFIGTWLHSFDANGNVIVEDIKKNEWRQGPLNKPTGTFLCVKLSNEIVVSHGNAINTLKINTVRSILWAYFSSHYYIIFCLVTYISTGSQSLQATDEIFRKTSDNATTGVCIRNINHENKYVILQREDQGTNLFFKNIKIPWIEFFSWWWL